MTADQDLSARLAELNGNANGGSKAALLGFWDALDEAWASGQLLTIADHERATQAAVAKAVEAEREACAQLIFENMLCEATGGKEVLRPRSNPGNTVGVAYAAAIRSRGVAE